MKNLVKKTVIVGLMILLIGTTTACSLPFQSDLEEGELSVSISTPYVSILSNNIESLSVDVTFHNTLAETQKIFLNDLSFQLVNSQTINLSYETNTSLPNYDGASFDVFSNDSEIVTLTASEYDFNSLFGQKTVIVSYQSEVLFSDLVQFVEYDLLPEISLLSNYAYEWNVDTSSYTQELKLKIEITNNTVHNITINKSDFTPFLLNDINSVVEFTMTKEYTGTGELQSYEINSGETEYVIIVITRDLLDTSLISDSEAIRLNYLYDQTIFEGELEQLYIDFYSNEIEFPSANAQ